MSWLAAKGPHTPKAARALQIATYSLSVVFGVLTLFLPAVSIQSVIGLHFTYFYALLVAIGGAGVLYGLLKPNYKIELAFLWVITSGFLIYDLGLWGILVDRLIHPIDLLPPSYGPAIAVLIIPLFLARKMIYLAKEAKKLIKETDDAGAD